MDSIILEEIPSAILVPREKASDPNYIKHVVCDGAHFHVLSYSTQGTHCSEPNCIMNKPKDTDYER